ncbi:VirB3 family type IV secretion system protein [uncultured Roseibium sp.]|uniref:VirB3 family type IV secretion system protein n=1 Tax=uncultured Roseibium sp. TaxID=1936171 RepID=UPI003438B32A
MQRSPLFKALTRPVSFAGLPANYLMILSFIIVGGFVVSKSFTYLIVGNFFGYVVLRIIAALDPRFFDVLFTVVQRTPLTSSIFRGKGVIYRA